MNRIDTSTLKHGVFHAIEINGYRIEGTIGGAGPYLIVHDQQRENQQLLALGSVCELHHITADRLRLDGKTGKPGWWFCKYDANQPTIDLSRLSETDVRLLAAEFGIEYVGHTRTKTTFYSSPAWRSLVDWVEVHPRKALKWSREVGANSYLPYWYDRAVEVRALHD